MNDNTRFWLNNVKLRKKDESGRVYIADCTLLLFIVIILAQSLCEIDIGSPKYVVQRTAATIATQGFGFRFELSYDHSLVSFCCFFLLFFLHTFFM